MCSEAYPYSEKMERSIKAILKTGIWLDALQSRELTMVHFYFLCLMGGGDHLAHTNNFEHHNEVGRSRPKNPRESCMTCLLSMR